MTKSEYLSELEVALSEFDAETRAEIIAECVDSFAAGERSGQTEQEIIDELGSVSECVETLRQLTSPIRGREDGGSNYNVGGEGDYPEICSLHIELDADVELKVGDTDSIDVILTGSEKLKDECSIETRGDTLYITGDVKRRGFSWIFGYDDDLRCCVMVPHRMKEIYIKLPGGDVKAVGIHADRYTVSTGGGDLKAEMCSIGEMSCTTGGGDHRMKDICASKLSCTSGGGDVVLSRIKVDELEAKTGGGDIALIDIKTNILDTKSGGGDIKAEGVYTQDCRSVTGGGDIRLSGEYAAKLIAKTGGGDISASFEKLEGAEILTSGGDVRIVSRQCVGATVSGVGMSNEAKVRYGSDVYKYEGSFKQQFGDGSACFFVKTIAGDINIELNSR